MMSHKWIQVALRNLFRTLPSIIAMAILKWMMMTRVCVVRRSLRIAEKTLGIVLMYVKKALVLHTEHDYFPNLGWSGLILQSVLLVLALFLPYDEYLVEMEFYSMMWCIVTCMELSSI